MTTSISVDLSDARQIKSKARVTAHGEVFTAPREVNAMLDLVKDETERLDSRFLEPACGTGNFLTAILARKLHVAERTAHLRTEYERQALLAVSSIYGIDIQKDNVDECRQRLYLQFIEAYHRHFPAEAGSPYLQSIRYIIHCNILWGDALSLCTPDDEKRPLVFAEWTLVGSEVNHRDFKLDMLLRSTSIPTPNLFSDLGDEAFIPTPCRTYSLTHYTKLHEQSQL